MTPREEAIAAVAREFATTYDEGSVVTVVFAAVGLDPDGQPLADLHREPAMCKQDPDRAVELGLICVLGDGYHTHSPARQT